MMFGFINNIYFWIIGFFVSVVISIMLFIVLFLIKLKTNAMVELKAFFKKTPVSIFVSDGKFLDMKALSVDCGLIKDKDYGLFIRNKKSSYLGKNNRNIYDIYDLSFAPGINVSAAKAAEELKNFGLTEDDYEILYKAIVSGETKDEKLDCLRCNVNLSHLKDFNDNIEPHNVNAAVEKKVAQQLKSMGVTNSMQSALVFIAILGAIVMGYILLKIVAK